MPIARIFQSPHNAMPAGKHAHTGQWILEFERIEAQHADPLTGWAGSGDTRGQVMLSFATLEAAIARADREGWAYHVQEAPPYRLKLQAYADNFR